MVRHNRHLVILILKCNLGRTNFTQVAVENLHTKDVVPLFKLGRSNCPALRRKQQSFYNMN